MADPVDEREMHHLRAFVDLMTTPVPGRREPTVGAGGGHGCAQRARRDGLAAPDDKGGPTVAPENHDRVFCCHDWLLSRCVAGHDFVTIEKPFTALLWVAIDTHAATAARHTEHLDHRPHLAHERWKRHASRPNRDPIPDVE